MSNLKFRRHVVSRGAQCPEDDMRRNVGESNLFKGVQVICSITALKLKVLLVLMRCVHSWYTFVPITLSLRIKDPYVNK